MFSVTLLYGTLLYDTHFLKGVGGGSYSLHLNYVVHILIETCHAFHISKMFRFYELSSSRVNPVGPNHLNASHKFHLSFCFTRHLCCGS